MVSTALPTVIETLPEVVLLPAVSNALARTVWVPSGTVDESQLMLYGELLSLPASVLPSTRKSTWATATLSDALADIGTLPLTLAPSAGVVRLTVGAVVSIVTSCVFTASALPALSKARYLTVVVAATVNGAT